METATAITEEMTLKIELGGVTFEPGEHSDRIQKLLGHEDIRTTLIYAKVTDRDVTKVKSPLDSL